MRNPRNKIVLVPITWIFLPLVHHPQTLVSRRPGPACWYLEAVALLTIPPSFDAHEGYRSAIVCLVTNLCRSAFAERALSGMFLSWNWSVGDLQRLSFHHWVWEK